MKILWKGYITFGLINIPIRIHSADKSKALHFKLLDSRDKSRIRYERINEKTGKEVPWNKIVKAYQLNRDNYIITKDNDKTPIKNSTNVEVDCFVIPNKINPIFLDKPYYLIPEGPSPKAFVLFREVLMRTKRIAIAKLTIRGHEHIAAIYPFKNILVMQILRFARDLIDVTELNASKINLDAKQLKSRELDLAEKLIGHMSHNWQPEKYHDESREKMLAKINKQIKKGKYIELPEEKTKPIKTTQDVIYLLEKSIPVPKKKN